MNDFTSARRSSSSFSNSADVFGSPVSVCDVGEEAAGAGEGWTGLLAWLTDAPVTGEAGAVGRDVKA